jgi:hypothetical protein
VTARGKPRVAWLSPVVLERTPQGYTSPLASQRYRIAIPHLELRRQDCESSVHLLMVGAPPRRLLDQLKGVDVVVVSKLWNPPEPRGLEMLMRVIEGLRARGTRVLADFCDDNFTDPKRGPPDVALANSVDALVASTPALAEVLRAMAPAPVTVISDPVEGSRGEPNPPKVDGRAPVSLLWFGHAMNFPTLAEGARQLEAAATEVPYSLVVVSSPGSQKEGWVAERDQAWRPAGRSCRFRPWSVQTVFDALRECDAVIIPSDPADPRKAVKSPNRFTESVWAGRLVLAHPLPAYLPLAQCGWVGENLAEGLRWLARHPEEAVARIRAGQERVAAEYSPQTIGAAWKRAIEAA